jgi:AraC-like DNA-binding protein
MSAQEESLDGWSLFRDTHLGESRDAAICLADLLSTNELFHSADDGTRIFPDHATEPFMRGRYRASTVRPYVQSIDCDFEAVSSLRVRALYTPCLCLSLLMNGAWSSTVDGKLLEFARPNVATMLAVGEPIEVATAQSIGQRSRMAAIYIGADFFQNADRMDTSLDCLTALLKSGLSHRELPTCDVLRDVLARLYCNPYRGTMARLYAESLTLSAIVELAGHMTGGCGVRPRLLRSHYDKAYEARRILATTGGPLPTLAELAGAVGTSETTLRRLFKAAFGVGIVEFARNERLDASRVMLRENRFRIAEVAYRIGYSSPANFTIAFKKRFGYPPKFENGRV